MGRKTNRAFGRDHYCRCCHSRKAYREGKCRKCYEREQQAAMLSMPARW